MPEDMGHFRRSFEERRLSLVARLAPGHGARVLDVGCGSGRLSELLADRGAAVHSLDIGHDSLVRAARRLGGRKDVRFVLGDVYRLPFDDASFDAGIVSEVLEHLDSPAEALGELARVVRPNGVLILSAPWRETIEQTLCIHCNRKTPVNAHLHTFDGDSLSTLLDDAGWTVERSITFASRPAERLGLAGITSFLPYPLWRAADRAACMLFGREGFVATRARKRD